MTKSNLLNISSLSPTPLSSSVSPVQEWLIYKSSEFKIQVKYLSTWSYQLKDNPWDSIVVFFPKDQQNLEVKDVKVAVSVEPLSNLISLSQYVSSFEKEILKDNEESKLIETSEYLMINASGRKITYKFKRNDSVIRKVAFVTLRDKRAYIIYYETTLEAFPKFEQIAEDMAKSLQIENPK